MKRAHQKRAFVIQLDSSADIEKGQIEGKVEHVSSVRTKRFQSLDELLSFVGSSLREVRLEERGDHLEI